MEAGTGSGNKHVEHWRAAADMCRAVLEKVGLLHARRSQIGLAQGEAILNSAQCVQLLIRYCVEPRMLHLLRAMPPCRAAGTVEPLDLELQIAFAKLFGIERLDHGERLQLSLPTRLGGLGIGSLAHRHQCAYLGSWALVLHDVLARLPPGDAVSLQEAL
eukprot:3472957-Karenia_brevis.AAC.1